jgi:sugar O-acyltransferase (sialic acid O-acetyltransferase NeuD family)
LGTNKDARGDPTVSRKILIYGAGGAGKELAFALSLDRNPDTAWKVQGFIDDTEHLWGHLVNDLPVLGGGEYLKTYSGNIAVCIVNDPIVKRNLIQNIRKNEKIKFPVVICSNTIVSPYVEWGEGSIVSPLNFIQPNTKFGDFVWINGGNRIGHDAVTGDYTTIFSGTLIGGGVCIGSHCVIGSGAILLPKIQIGDGSIIGGGSVVSKDIPPKVLAAGVPAKIIREIK